MQQWPQQNAFQGAYTQGQQRPPVLQAQIPQPIKPLNTIPYAYGQLPSTANPADPKSQHPIPGSFNRHAFNPKTQSFVPGNGGTVHQPLPQHSSPPMMHYNNFPPPQQYSTTQQYGNGNLGYNMARQGSNNSLPSSYHASPHMATRPVMHQGMAHGHPSMPPMPPMPQGMPQNMNTGHQHGSHLPHFGNASTLPPKPPPAV